MNFASVLILCRRVLARLMPRWIREKSLPVAESHPDLWTFVSDYSWLRSRAWLVTHPEVITPATVVSLQDMRSLALQAELRRALDDHIEVIRKCLRHSVEDVFDQLVHARGPLKLSQGVLSGPPNRQCFDRLYQIAVQTDEEGADLVELLPEAVSEKFDLWLGDTIQSLTECEGVKAIIDLRCNLARIRFALASRHAERLFDQHQWGAAFWTYRSVAQALYSLHRAASASRPQARREGETTLLREHYRDRFERYALCRAMLHDQDDLEASAFEDPVLSDSERTAITQMLQAVDAAVITADRYFSEDAWECAARHYEIALRAKRRALYHPACASYREALRTIFPECGRNHAYALARLGQMEECAGTLELSHATFVGELTERLEYGWSGRSIVGSLSVAEAAQINPIATDFAYPLMGEVSVWLATLLRLMTTEERQFFSSLPPGHEDQKKIAQKYADKLPPVGLRMSGDVLTRTRREFVDAHQSLASDRAVFDADVFRFALAQSALKRWRKLENQDPSFDAEEYSRLYSLCGHTASSCLPAYPLVQVATTAKGTIAVLSHITEKLEVETSMLEIAFTSEDLDSLMRSSGCDQGWLDGLARQSHDSSSWVKWEETVQRISKRLGTSLMEQLVKWISSNYSGCILIPHGRLSLLPLHAANWPTSSGSACVLDFLDIAFAPSVGLVAQARENFTRTRVLGLVAVVDPRPTSQAPIPCARMEIDAIAPRFTSRWAAGRIVASICDGDGVSRDSVLGYLNGEYNQVAHFACHAVTEASLPHRSGIVLSEDERLTASDLLRIRSSTGRLAVLSCCETALLDQSHPDEALSFPATLLGCGFAGAIGSLWEVDDVSTALLMIRFYEEWFDNGLHPSAALRSAQRWLSNASRGEIGEYVSDERLPWYYERVPPSQQETLREAWTGLRNMLPDSLSTERPFSSPVYWSAFLAFGV